MDGITLLTALLLPLAADAAAIRTLQEGDPLDRVYAMRYLGEHRVHAAVPFLIQALNDHEDYIRGAAASSLGDIGNHAAVLPLVRVCERYKASKGGSHFEEKVAESAYWALQKITGEHFGFDLAAWHRYVRVRY